MFTLVEFSNREAIMYRVVRTIAMIMVLAHLACGCCLHHAHAFGLQPSDTPAVETSCPCGHHEHEDGSEPGDHQPFDQGCHHDQCEFARVESGGTSQVLIDACCVPLVSVVPMSPPVNRIDAGDRTPHHLGPPIPVHLLNQALLL